VTAHPRRPRRRGEPLAALMLLIGGWTGARLLLWESPFVGAASASGKTPPIVESPVPQRGFPTANEFSATPVLQAPGVRRSWSPSTLRSFPALIPPLQTVTGSSIAPQIPQQVRALPPALASSVNAAVAPTNVPLALASVTSASRWHFGAWFAWRDGSGLPRVANGAGAASYGGSQVGAMVQFDLARGPHRPALHMRATYAPDRPRHAEIAGGIGVRPLGSLPIRVMGEARATQTAGRTEIRPAAFAVTEIPRLTLPWRLQAEGYGQAGWVGGRYATAFADGQVRVTRVVASTGRVRFRAGAGTWGGAQKFAERIDVGPTVSAELAQDKLPLRLPLDYRLRVAGNASPGDGPSLTLSTGF